MGFKIEAFQNRYLAPGSARVDAIVSVMSDPNLKATRDLVVGFIVDKSGSMANGRIEAVHGAVSKAISMLTDGTWFFVVVSVAVVFRRKPLRAPAASAPYRCARLNSRPLFFIEPAFTTGASAGSGTPRLQGNGAETSRPVLVER